MANQKHDNFFRLMLIGDDGGKTSIIKRFHDNVFKTYLPTTIGVEYKIKTIQLNGKKIKLQIWDTGSLERYLKETTAEYHRVMGIMLVYDITNKDSFINLKNWLKLVDEHAHEDVEKIILGNKCDLDEKRQVPKEKAEAFAKEHGIKFMETSANSNINIDKAFHDLTEAILNNKNLQDRVNLYTELYNDEVDDSKTNKKCF